MATWLNLLAVACGGAVGSLLRYLITLLAIAIPGGSSLWGTTVANVLGCAALGGLIQYTAAEQGIDERLQLAIQVGLLGGLTTFSTFAAESAQLATAGRLPLASLYMAANLLLGWAALVGAAEGVKAWSA